MQAIVIKDLFKILTDKLHYIKNYIYDYDKMKTVFL